MRNESPQLLYDAACPVCRREIALVRRLTRRVTFVDVHQLSPSAYPAGTTEPELLLDLHLVWPDGHIDKGLDANIRLWQQTPLGWLWQAFRLPMVRPIAERVYRRWADRRYTNMGYCSTTKPVNRQSEQLSD